MTKRMRKKREYENSYKILNANDPQPSNVFISFWFPIKRSNATTSVVYFRFSSKYPCARAYFLLYRSNRLPVIINNSNNTIIRQKNGRYSMHVGGQRVIYLYRMKQGKRRFFRSVKKRPLQTNEVLNSRKTDKSRIRREKHIIVVIVSH